MTLVIGLTGSIGTGKSMVANQFRSCHIPVIDADTIARDVVRPRKEAYKRIVETFGSSILHEDKTLNRPALGNIVFQDKKKRETLNAIIHPEIRKEMLKTRDTYIKEAAPCVVMDIPLLFESKLTDFVDKIIVVAVDPDTQLKRIMTRDNNSVEEAKQRIASQMPVSEKVKKSDAVIDNNGTVAESQEQLKTILYQWGISCIN